MLDMAIRKLLIAKFRRYASAYLLKHFLMQSQVRLFFTTTILLIAKLASPQDSNFSLQMNYGIQGNFFVTNYSENALPAGYKAFYKKKFIGSIGGLELIYDINKTSAIAIAYARSTNGKVVNYTGTIQGASVNIRDLTIRHINNFYQLYYDKSILNKSWAAIVGIMYLRMRQQEVDLSPSSITFEERNFKNSKLEEAGIFAGIRYQLKIDKRFKAGLQSRLYYLVSTGALEAVTLMPTLTYNF